MKKDIQIIRADSYGLRRRFYLFSHRLYREDPAWREPAVWGGKRMLSPAHNPLLRSEHALLLAQEGPETLARVLVGPGYFSLFDACERPDAVRRLMSAAAGYQRAWGCERMAGPIAPTQLEMGGGVLVEGFAWEAPLFDAQNARYYGDLLEQCGFRAAADELAYRIPRECFDQEKYQKMAAWARDRFGLTVETGLERRPRELAQAMKRVTGEETEDANRLIGALDGYLARDLCPVARAADGTPAGILLSVREGRGRVRLTTVWVAPEWRRRGVYGVLLAGFVREALKQELEGADASSIRADNLASLKGVEGAGGQLIRRYRRYELRV